eukprot:gb/GEZN01006900.1/.p1 GENE.gb/GEZN01006900.1/~~gb/GEZN01006900.1/.p1  ORF type:complete len:170 (+),score=23.06 gb/GEZN01006900.1/:975-1484(+)
MDAYVYLDVHRAHWFHAGRTKVDGGVSALFNAVQKAGASVYRKWKAGSAANAAAVHPPIKLPTTEMVGKYALCGESGAAKRLLKCSVCRQTSYCGSICQMKDWKERHKRCCEQLKLVGKRIELHSLTTAALNGSHGVAESFDAERQRFVIKLDAGKTVSIKAANVKRIN